LSVRVKAGSDLFRTAEIGIRAVASVRAAKCSITPLVAVANLVGAGAANYRLADIEAAKPFRTTGEGARCLVIAET
jgi:hypothetical protein